MSEDYQLDEFMSEEEGKKRAMEALKPWAYMGGIEYEDKVIAAVAKAIRQAYADAAELYGDRRDD